MNKEIPRKKKFWTLFCIIAAILIIAGLISDLNKPVWGLYKSAFPQFSIELQKGGKLWISPYSNTNKTPYCVTEGSWIKDSNNITLSFDNNLNCDWINKLRGTWRLTKCKNFDGSSNWCISNGDFTLKKEN